MVASIVMVVRIYAATETRVSPAAATAATAATAPPAAPAPTLPSIAPDTGEEIRRRVLRPYKVILHNDEHNSMEHVIESLRKAVPGMTLGKATAIMWEAHTSGKAVVIACPLELAEL